MRISAPHAMARGSTYIMVTRRDDCEAGDAALATGAGDRPLRRRSIGFAWLPPVSDLPRSSIILLISQFLSIHLASFPFRNHYCFLLTLCLPGALTRNANQTDAGRCCQSDGNAGPGSRDLLGSNVARLRPRRHRERRAVVLRAVSRRQAVAPHDHPIRARA